LGFFSQENLTKKRKQPQIIRKIGI